MPLSTASIVKCATAANAELSHRNPCERAGKQPMRTPETSETTGDATRNPSCPPLASADGSVPVVCVGEKHDWEENYYGIECRRCHLFYPDGCEPWLPDSYQDWR